MYNLLIFLFVVNAIFLVLVILMQSDKAGSLSSTFGGMGGSATSAFGGRETANFLHKFTVALTVVFFVLAIAIGLMSKTEFSQTTNAPASIMMERGQDSPASTLPTLDGNLLPDASVEGSEGTPAKVETEKTTLPVAPTKTEETKKETTDKK